jgi:PhnB protein
MTPSKRKPAKRAAKKPVALPTPRGFHTVTPYLAVAGGTAAIEFYKRAFGARELARSTTPGGQIIHARLKIGDSIVMLSDVFEGSDRTAPSSVGTSTVTLHIYTPDVDAMWNRAVDAGAKITMALDDQFWGERYGHLVDPFGHRWSLSTPIRMSRAVMDAKRKEAFRAFSKGEHPSKDPEFSDI